MQILLIIIFTLGSIASFWVFLAGRFRLSPLWLMLSVWFISIAIAQLHLSSLEIIWPGKFWYLVLISLLSFAVGVLAFDKFWDKFPWWERLKFLTKDYLNEKNLRIIVYCLFGLSVLGLYLFFRRAGNFPILTVDPDEFRFVADSQVPGLINYCAQLARVFIPLSFFLFFFQGFSLKKHWDLVLICLIGTASLIMFASRTQIFFIDLWVMALYLFMRKPTLKQAVKFYPFFLALSIVVLAAVPLIRQYKSYGSGYLEHITAIDSSQYSAWQKAFIPIYVGISFNQQALLHADMYYNTHPIQYGKVSLDPFTNLFGKVIPGLNNLKSHYDLGQIFYSWWNTGTYLFPFVQDFGESAFYFIPFLIAGLLTMLWHYWKSSPNFFSINLYAYAMFFIVMTVYLSFTVRAEMYIDLFLLLLAFLYVSKPQYDVQS